MSDREDEFPIGTRVRLSGLGRMRSRKTRVETGVVVGKPHRSDAVRVLMDGKVQPVTLHKTYLERE